MILKTYAMLLLGHILGDIIFASYHLSTFKRNPYLLNQILGVGSHCGIHAIVTGIILAIAGRLWLQGSLLVFVIHFLVDIIRSNVEMKRYGPGRIYVKRSEFMAWITGKSKNPEKMNVKNLRPWIVINILDQTAHLVSLYFIAYAV